MLEELERQLTELEPYEKMGQMHLQKYGKNLSYTQLIYCVRHGDSVSHPEQLYTNAAQLEQLQISEELREKNSFGILRGKNFLADDRNIEVQKLLRYVDIPPHQHDFIECAYVLCGTCIHRINEHNFNQEQGSFVMIPPEYRHVLFPENDCVCLTVKLRTNTFWEMQLPKKASFVYPKAYYCGDDPAVHNLMLSLWQQQIEQRLYSDELMVSMFKTLLLLLLQYFQDVQPLIVHDQANQQMVEILTFMADHYQTISLESVAVRFHYNPSYLSRRFHIATGTTFSDMVRTYRLQQAARLLVEGTRPVDEICELVGYSDTTQFIKNFKKLYGMTPLNYRKQYRASLT